MKNYSFFLLFASLWAASASCVQPCTEENQAPVIPPAAPKQALRSLSRAEMDSFLLFEGKVPPLSMWEKIWVDTIIKPQPLHFLSGNLDNDGTSEKIIWHSGEALGRAICFDLRDSVWVRTGETDLNFFHGDNPPRIDSKTKMLLTYDYGWGSGYGSEVLNFNQIQQDSFVCVFSLLEKEGLNVMGCPAIRFIDARYQFIGSKKIQTVYRYRVIEEKTGHSGGRTIFQKTIEVPCIWDPSQNRFISKYPQGLAKLIEDETVEYPFDTFFESELEHLKWKGPRWKRRALGNPYEE